jgi:hypothetical protein
MVAAQLTGPIFENDAQFALFLFAVVVIGFGGLVLTIVGAVRAGARGDVLWLVAIVGSFFFGLSWIVAIAYLLTIRSSRTSQPAAAPIGRSYYCTDCGRAAPPGANFCMSCGAQIKTQARRPFR